MNNIEIAIFLTGTLLIAWISWKGSLKAKRFHGIYRFFSFECILLLILMNYPGWFRNPLSIHQMISWILLLLALIIAIYGFCLLYRKGKPEKQIENTTVIVETGLYKYIRHPLYLSLILGGFGILAKDYGYLQGSLSVVNFISLTLTAKVEEKEMVRKFGKEYVDYMKRTKMFVPYIF